MCSREIVVQGADQVPRRDFIEALNAAYNDYYVPIYLSLASFERLVTREAICLEASAVALIAGQIVGMGLLGVRERRAWIGGMGVLPEFRHRGIGRRIMAYLLDQARRMRMEHIQLEVITTNQAALSLYQSMGFETTRELLVLSGEGKLSRSIAPKAPPGIRIKSADVVTLLMQMPASVVASAPWQRTFASLFQIQGRLDGLSAYDDDSRLNGLCLWSGDDRQVGIYVLSATTPEIVEALLSRLLVRLPSAQFSYLNVPCDDPAVPVLRSVGFQETIRQYEMHLELVDG